MVMMCGDGTNDVGALKAADVGVALLSSISSSSSSTITASSYGARACFGSAPTSQSKLAIKVASANDGANSYARVGEHTPMSRRFEYREDVMRRLTKEREWTDDDRSAVGRVGVIVRPGDASLAAPFTAKSTGIAPCVDVVRQGRAALMTTLQMFKILGLNCLCTAYVMSVQFLDGIKFGNRQLTIAGLLTTSVFMVLSTLKNQRIG